MLIIVHEAHFSAVLRVEVVLAGAKIVLFFSEGSCVRLLLSLERGSNRIILTEAVVESSFAGSGAVKRSETAVVAGDVRVSATTVVCVDDGL